MTDDPMALDQVHIQEKIKTGKNFNPGEAFWCEEHHRLECTTKKKGNRAEGNRNPDARCHNLAMKGTNKCRIHPGGRRDVVKARGRTLINAWSVLGDASKAVDHRIAVLGVLQMTWLRLNLYSEMLRKQIYMTDGITPRGAAQ